MKRLAELFSVAFLVALILGAAAILWLPPLEHLPRPPLSGSVDRIVVEKAARRITLWQNGQAVREYTVALGFSPSGDKSRQGDGRTPEGLFRINRRNDRSAYHLSLGIDYPRPEDVQRAKAGGYDPGGDIMIHGQPNALPDSAVLRGDWTAGCIALSNAEIREIWNAAPIGTLVEILP